MGAVRLGDKAVGSVVKLNENGVAVDYLVVHQGLPSAMYDASCDGTWLLRKEAGIALPWGDSDSNDYSSSGIDVYLNKTFISCFAINIQSVVKKVKIPYRIGSGTGIDVNCGKNGHLCRTFLLSGREVGWTASDILSFPEDGVKLAYFDEGDDAAAKNKRIASVEGGAATIWWLRTPITTSANVYAAQSVYNLGTMYSAGCAKTFNVRPALILPLTLLVLDTGEITTNTPPAISGSDSSLGTKTGAFTQAYTVTDSDPGQTITVTEKLNSTTKRTYTATSGESNSFAITATEWRELLNGTHTITITADDGNGGTATRTWTFTKAETQIELTLATPLPADAMVTKAIMNITRQLPVGVLFTVEVCNNAFDAAPAWQDVTQAITGGTKFFLSNTSKTAAKWGYNFRVKINRNGKTGDCYIQNIGGNFE